MCDKRRLNKHKRLTCKQVLISRRHTFAKMFLSYIFNKAFLNGEQSKKKKKRKEKTSKLISNELHNFNRKVNVEKHMIGR